MNFVLYTCIYPRTPHLSLSLNTRMDVLYTLMAKSGQVSAPPVAWYTFASLPAFVSNTHADAQEHVRDEAVGNLP